uniref:LURP-one-related family protein n=1 Tax=Panagrolaimus sp. PS1159 TaxID=55785 RepID=A0AC35FZM9_9BILA
MSYERYEEAKLAGARKYKIREKIFSLRDNFQIKDEFDVIAYTVRSKLLTIGDKLTLESPEGIPLVRIEQEVMHLLAHYNIISAINDQTLATLKQKWTWLKHKCEITSVFGLYELTGNIIAYEFVITKNGEVVATVSKKWFSWTDSYGVEVVETEDHAFIMALVIVVDQIYHKP